MTDAISQKHQKIYLMLILVLGAVLRLLRLGSQSFWYDEVYSANLSVRSLEVVVSRFGQTPTLYHILLHFWLYLGRSDTMIRLLSVVFGVIALWVIYLVGKSLLDAKYGLLCAFLLAISPFHIWYSQEARMYSLLILLSTASVLFFIKFLREHRGWSSVWWVLTTGFAIYTHYYAAFILLGQVAFFLIFLKRYRSLVRHISIGLGAVVILVLPIFFLLFSGGRYEVVSAEGAGGNPVQIFSVPYTFFAFSLGFSYGPSITELRRLIFLATVRPYLAQILPVLLLFSALFVMGLSSLWQERERLAFVLLYLMVPIVGACLVSLLWPRVSYNVRYVSMALPAYGFILSRGLLAPRNRLIRWALMLLVLMATVVSIRNHYYIDKYAKEDHRSAAQFVSAHSEDGDVILVAQPKPFKYYYRGPLVTHTLFWSPRFYQQMIGERIHGFDRAWLVMSRRWEWVLDQEGRTKSYMKSTFPVVIETTFANLYLGLFELPSTEGH